MAKEKPFVNKAETVTLANGDVVVLPRLTLGRIIKVTDSMDKLITTAKEKAPEVFSLLTGLDTGNSTVVGMKIMQSLPTLFPIVIKEVITVISEYTDKDRAYVEDSMDMEDLVAIATPFFANILKQANHLTGPLSQMFTPAKTSSESFPT